MKKKVLFVLLLLCVCLVGCEKKKDVNLSGGWETGSKYESYLPVEAANLFYKTTTDANEQAVPIALLGKQVVAGTNYMFLVQKDNSYYVYVIYENLENKTSIINRSTFDLTKYVNENKEMDSKALVGGWKVEIPDSDIPSMKLDEKIQKIFDKATEKLVGMTYYPVTVLGKQIVSGTNYAVVAYGQPSTKELANVSNTGVFILTLYEDLHGTCEIVSSSYVDLAEYNS